MNRLLWLRPRLSTLVLWLMLFLLMPSFFYSNLICRIVVDVVFCGWQFIPYLGGVASLLSLQDQLSSQWQAISEIVPMLIGIGLNMLLAYGLAAGIMTR